MGGSGALLRGTSVAINLWLSGSIRKLIHVVGVKNKLHFAAHIIFRLIYDDYVHNTDCTHQTDPDFKN